MGWKHRERVLAALEHERTDRVPIDFGSTDATAIVDAACRALVSHLGMEYRTRMVSARHSLVCPSEEVLRLFGVDTRGVKPWCDAEERQGLPQDDLFVDQFGVTWRRPREGANPQFVYIDGPFYDVEPSIDAIEAFQWPDAEGPEVIEGVRERVEEIKNSGQFAIVLHLPGGGVIHRGYALRGFTQYLKELYKAPDFLCRMMDHLADYFIRIAERTIEAAGPGNIDVIYLGEDLGTQNGCMFSPEIYRKLIKPRHRRIVETIKSLTKAKILFHCCGSAYHFIDDLIDIGVDVLNPVQVTAKDMQPERLKAEFGDRIAFWGGINSQETLPLGTPQEVRAETRRIIDILGKGGGYVLNSVHNIQPGVPPENIVAMFDEGKTYRPPEG